METMMSIGDLHAFYSVDREIFTRLVINLIRDPAQSLLIMALWLCLEDLNFSNITRYIRGLSNAKLNALATEAVACLMCLESKTHPELDDDDIPLTAIALRRRRVSLSLFYQNKFTLICNIKAFLNNVCAIAFADILQSRIFPSLRPILNCPLIIPGFPHPTYGSIAVIPRAFNYVFPSKGLWGWSLNIEAPVDDRTMFLTFSRGYPVTEIEVRELFTSYYGDCIEHVRMEPSPAYADQCLYARLLVRNISTVDRILSRGPIAKLKINGKHVWARKFERRESLHHV